MTRIRARLLVDGNPLVSLGDHAFLFNPMTEAEGEPVEVADTLFVLEPAALTGPGDTASAVGWELENGVRYFQRVDSEIFGSFSFKRHLQARGKSIPPGLLDEKVWRRFHAGLPGRVHALDPSRVLERSGALVGLVPVTRSEASLAVPAAAHLIRLSSDSGLVVFADASACPGTLPAEPLGALDLLVLSMATRVPEEDIVAFVAALAPRQLLLAHNSFGKKLRARLEPLLETAAPNTELLTGR